MKLMIGILFICIGLVMGLPYIVDTTDTVADPTNGHGQLNSFSNQTVKSYDDAADAGIDSVDGTLAVDNNSNDQTLVEPLPPVDKNPSKPVPAIDIAAYPGQTINRPPIKHKWSTNKFMAKPVSATTNP